MFTSIKKKTKARDVEEKPFWISFSDLMTALMTLFLTIMAVTIVLISKAPTTEQQQKKKHKEAIENIIKKIKAQNIAEFEEVKFGEDTNSINLGPKAQFRVGDERIAEEKKAFIRKYVSELLKIVATEEGRKNIKKVYVEGFADPSGSYFKNLNLSIDRSHAVFCALFDKVQGEQLLTLDERIIVRNYFSMGGYSYNERKGSDEESRRVELRIDFRAYDESTPEQIVSSQKEITEADFGNCDDRFKNGKSI